MGKFLLVVVVFAALVYGFFWLLERRRTGPRSAPTVRPRPLPRVLGPDDDEDFLRELERRRRRASREKRKDHTEPGQAEPKDPSES